MTESVSSATGSNNVCAHLLINTVQLGITMLEPQLIVDSSSVGKLFPDVEPRVLREDGSEADVNEPGESYVWRGV